MYTFGLSSHVYLTQIEKSRIGILYKKEKLVFFINSGQETLNLKSG